MKASVVEDDATRLIPVMKDAKAIPPCGVEIALRGRGKRGAERGGVLRFRLLRRVLVF